jgi:protein SCO1/2
MKAVFALITLWLTVAPVGAHEGAPPPIRYEQHLAARLPLDLVMVDERGRAVTLRRYFGGPPLVLVFGYLHCANLCDTVLEGVTEALERGGLAANRDYRALYVSIDPRDGPVMAAEAKARRIPAGEQSAWHFLSGRDGSAAALANAGGFRYRYEPRNEQYVHPAGFIVVTPRGEIAQYFPGVRFDPPAVARALKLAADERTGSLAGDLLLLCHRVDPGGLYTAAILGVLRVAGLLFLIGAALWLWRLQRR